ncbi:RtcB family protein [Zavarzinella formosa]|uniref:RtcB family protein n=1 Tax=Zavarzinella formosa TaxID=360055 RepID=UPI000300B003|nr:RtcB family protein [Zavarzinella formosa]
MQFLGKATVPIQGWTEGVLVEEKALQQLLNVASLPFIHKHVAVMPDVHWGMGATVGSVIPTVGAIIPAAVGVDIGCGMMAVRTEINADDLPDNLHAIRSDIEAAIPHGRTDNGGVNDRGAWGDPSPDADWVFSTKLMGRLQAIVAKHPGIAKAAERAPFHLGTLGTGNHFIELCLDGDGAVWVMLHSGSRGIGNKIGTYFIERAKAEMRRWFVNLPDADLAYLPEGSELFDDYVEALHWAQEFAQANREVMMRSVLGVLERHFPGKLGNVDEVAVNCHHNYVTKENHYGKNVWLTRKGAVRARKGDLGIIPGSMGARSYIVRGKGCDESFHSCSHGAGRVMSRGEAIKRISLEDHVKATAGVECRKDEGVLDESPAAYKPIDAVLAAQKDLVEIVHELRQVICVKG